MSALTGKLGCDLRYTDAIMGLVGKTWSELRCYCAMPGRQQTARRQAPGPGERDHEQVRERRQGLASRREGFNLDTGQQAVTLMAGDAGEYARLYTCTQEAHYLDVARILLDNTRNMVRTYGFIGQGWQQEGWSLLPRRRISGQRNWVPWVTVNHLEGVLELEDLYPAVAKKLAQKPE
jgi:hypothetical protein